MQVPGVAAVAAVAVVVAAAIGRGLPVGPEAVGAGRWCCKAVCSRYLRLMGGIHKEEIENQI